MFYCFIHNWYSSEEPCKVCCPLVTSTLSTSTIGTNSDEPPKPQAENKPDIPKTSKSMTTDYEPFENRVGFDKPDRDWEIVGYTGKYMGNDNVLFTKTLGGDFSPNASFSYGVTHSEQELINNKCVIKSVLRKSDSQVFSVGDDSNFGEILGFEIFGEKMKVNYYGAGNWQWLSSVSKLPPQPQKLKLFTTEDGVDVYDGDMYFIMNTHNHHIAPNYYRAYKSCLTGDKPTIKYFSTKEAAEKYLAENKPQPQKEKQPPQRCGICGGELVLIRGRYPNTDKRKVCPTCNTERLEQINEISSNGYGQAYQVK